MPAATNFEAMWGFVQVNLIASLLPTSTTFIKLSFLGPANLLLTHILPTFKVLLLLFPHFISLCFWVCTFWKYLYYEFNRVSVEGKHKCMCLIFHCYPSAFVYITQRKLLISVLDDPRTRMRRGERTWHLMEAASYTYLNRLSLGMVDKTLISTPSLLLWLSFSWTSTLHLPFLTNAFFLTC